MDTKSKIAIALTFLALIIVGFKKYEVFLTSENFIVYNHVACDLGFESCFVSDCDPSEGECDATPYKKIEKLATRIPDCSPLEDCQDLSCDIGETDCIVISCSDETVEEGEVCSGPLAPEGSENFSETDSSAVNSGESE